MLRRWRRLDEPGLEVLRVVATDDGFRVTSSLVHAGADPFGLQYQWSLDKEWRTKSLQLDLATSEHRLLEIERDGDASWRIDGRPRPDLNGCDEVDLSATPFCNTLAIRRMAGTTGELTTVYVSFPDLSVTPSRQRYEAIGDNCWRYVDLGVAHGFTARVETDAEGFVAQYEGLFEALPDT
jgi:hypothetical protein